MRKSRSCVASSSFRLRLAAGIILLASCGEQQEPRAARIVARRLGGDSVALGAVLKACKPEDEACVPAIAVMCSVTWAGDPAQKPNMPQLSPEEQAWCATHSGTDRRSR